MTHLLRNLLTASALAFQLIYAPVTRAEPRENIVSEKVVEVNTSPIGIDVPEKQFPVLEDRVDIPLLDSPRKYVFGFEVGSSIIDPGKLHFPEGSLASKIDEEEFYLPIMGIYFDTVLVQGPIGNIAEHNLSVGGFVSYSSSQLWRHPLKDSGSTRYGVTPVDYTLRGDFHHGTVGGRLTEKISLGNDSFAIGISADISAYFTWFLSSLQLDVDVVDESVRKSMRLLGLPSQDNGNIDLSAFGGALRMQAGPSNRIFSIECILGVGAQYMGLRVTSDEQLQSGTVDGRHSIDYHDFDFSLGARCGWILQK